MRTLKPRATPETPKEKFMADLARRRANRERRANAATLRQAGIRLRAMRRGVLTKSLRAAGLEPASRSLADLVIALGDHLVAVVPEVHRSPCESCGVSIDSRRECPFCEAPLSGPLGVRDRLLTSADGSPRSCASNAITLLDGDEAWRGLLGYDELRSRVTLTRPGPWGGSGPWADEDATRTADWMAREHGLFVRSHVAEEAAHVVAQRHPFHPVRDHLRSLQWDRRPRIDGWLSDYCGADDAPHVRAIAAKSLIAAVARVERPGCQVDHVPVLEGRQGIGKTTLVRALATRDEWACELTADLASKDAMQSLSGKWIVEMSELSAVSRSEVARCKSFLSERVDHYRPPYGRAPRDFPRQCVFIATTNDEEYLRDETGARRFWPVAVSRVDVARLRADVGQLWAEAHARYQAGEAWHVEDAATIAALARETESRFARDAWEAPIAEWLNDAFKRRERRRDGVSTSDILAHALNIDPGRRTRADEMRVAAVLRHLGWSAAQIRREGARVRLYRPNHVREVVTEVEAEASPRNSSPISPLSQPSQPLTKEDRDGDEGERRGRVERPGCDGRARPGRTLAARGEWP